MKKEMKEKSKREVSDESERKKITHTSEKKSSGISPIYYIITNRTIVKWHPNDKMTYVSHTK
jgi:V8-like Glu-specific endopeptidase